MIQPAKGSVTCGSCCGSAPTCSQCPQVRIGTVCVLCTVCEHMVLVMLMAMAMAMAMVIIIVSSPRMGPGATV